MEYRRSITIKELSEEKRPMEKLLAFGVEALSNEELLAIIIGSGYAGKNAIDLSREIFTRDIGEKELLYSTMEELMDIKGIGLSKASKIISGLELGKRLSSIDRFDRMVFNNPDTVANYFYNYYKNKKKEEFCIVLLDTKNRPLSVESISIGTINSSIVHPREVFTLAVKKQASSIILAHNHPSGDPSPSKEDILVTKRLVEVGNIIGIEVLDHIIVGFNKYESLKVRQII